MSLKTVELYFKYNDYIKECYNNCVNSNKCIHFSDDDGVPNLQKVENLEMSPTIYNRDIGLSILREYTMDFECFEKDLKKDLFKFRLAKIK